MKTAMDYEDEEREAMTPPPCPACGRRGSERNWLFFADTTTGGVCRRLETCPSSFHDAADYGPMLLDAARAYRELTVCYRINQTPSEALFARLYRAKGVLAAAEDREVHDEGK
jgi:hypothetical protein